MRKQFTVFSILIILPAVQAVQIEQIETYEATENIKGFKTDGKSVFATTENAVQKLSKNDSWTRRPKGSMSSNIDSFGNKLVVGTRSGGSSLLVYNKTGNKLLDIYLGSWIGSLGIYEGNNTFVTGTSADFLVAYRLNGTKMFERSDTTGRYIRKKSYDLDKDQRKELIVFAGEELRIINKTDP